MATKVKILNLQRDYKTYLYFIDGNGNVCRRHKSGESENEILVANAVIREVGFLYYLDKDGDVSCTPMARGKRAN